MFGVVEVSNKYQSQGYKNTNQGLKMSELTTKQLILMGSINTIFSGIKNGYLALGLVTNGSGVYSGHCG